MTLQNRVTPFGELAIDRARGLLMGNRGGRFHRDDRTLGGRRWASPQWICCMLSFKGRRRDVWRRSYTELFFLDEVTALAAGHRPCFECRRREAEHFAALFADAKPNSVRSRASAPAMDAVLHRERLDGKAKRLHRRNIDALPDGAMFALCGEAYAVRGGDLLRWSSSGYREIEPRRHALDVDVLTPPSILAALAKGYAPMWHPSADL